MASGSPPAFLLRSRRPPSTACRRGLRGLLPPRPRSWLLWPGSQRAPGALAGRTGQSTTATAPLLTQTHIAHMIILNNTLCFYKQHLYSLPENGQPKNGWSGSSCSLRLASSSAVFWVSGLIWCFLHIQLNEISQIRFRKRNIK